MTERREQPLYDSPPSDSGAVPVPSTIVVSPLTPIRQHDEASSQALHFLGTHANELAIDACVVFFVSMVLTFAVGFSAYFYLAGLFHLAAVFLVCGFVWRKAARIGKTRRCVRILNKTEDAGLLPFVIDMWPFHMSAKAKEAVALRLLPQLSVQDSQRLRSEHWDFLYRWLRGDNVPLVIAILQTIERCGSVSSLPHVRPLAAGKGLAKRHPQIQQLAQACEEKLQARLKRLDMPQTLLRGSAAPDSKALLRGSAAPVSETLLRPHLQSGETAPLQLLRAADKDEQID